ncbi:MAG: ABC transporter ATP-binding protein [Thermodesulfobacteriota bacterium]
MEVLRTENLTKNFGGLTAVNRVNFVLEEGRLQSIIGPNGAGKSTFFKMISGEHVPSSGKIWFKGEDITGLPQHVISHKGIATSYQITNIFPKLTTFENVRIAVQSRKTTFNFWTRADRHEDLNGKALQILETVGLREKKDVLACNLPHGDQRHLEIAIALATDPVLLLLDEPTAGLNPAETVETMELIKKISKGLSVILVEHKMKVIMNISEIITVLHDGQVIAVGTPEEIQENETVRKVYLGGRKE